MRDKYSARHGLADILTSLSDHFGYGDISKLSQDQMNSLGHRVDGVMNNQSSFLKYLYPDNDERDEIIKAWDEFYKQYWNAMSQGYNDLRVETDQ